MSESGERRRVGEIESCHEHVPNGESTADVLQDLSDVNGNGVIINKGSHKYCTHNSRHTTHDTPRSNCLLTPSSDWDAHHSVHVQEARSGFGSGAAATLCRGVWVFLHHQFVSRLKVVSLFAFLVCGSEGETRGLHHSPLRYCEMGL